MKVFAENYDYADAVSLEQKPDILRDPPGKEDRIVIVDNFKPFRIILKFCGLGAEHERGAKKILWTIYGTFILLCLVFAVFRVSYATVVTMKDSDLSNPTFTIGMAAVLFQTLSLINFIIMFKCDQLGTFSRICEQIPGMALENSSLKNKKTKRYVLVAVIMFWSMLISNEVVIVFVALRSKTFNLIFLYPADTDEYVWLAVFNLGIYVFVLTSWVLPLVFCGASVMLTTVLFKEHNKELEDDLQNLTEEKLERSRHRFTQLCEGLERLDNVCAPLNGVNFTLNIVTVILLVYGSIFTDINKLEGLGAGVWDGVVSTWVIIISVYAAIVAILAAILNHQVAEL